MKGLDQAKRGHTLGRKTMSLFYCTDFADRLENQIIPALRAGYYVLSDRYFYSIGARDIVRGADQEWLEDVYGFALVPDSHVYLKVRSRTWSRGRFTARVSTTGSPAWISHWATTSTIASGPINPG